MPLRPRVASRTLRSAFAITMPVAALLGAGTWAGCSSDNAAEESDASTNGSDAANDTAPPSDAGTDAKKKRDCKADEDVATGLVNHLECTGLYEDFPSQIAKTARPYKPGLEFWSDGAEKSRYVYLPPGAKIDTSNYDEWKFPNGMKLWKEFRLAGKKIETRIYEKVDGSWRHTVYRWNETQTDAVRLEPGEKIVNPDAPGTAYEIPNTTACNVCHDGRTEPVLGFEPILLALPTAQGVTLATLISEGRLTVPPASAQVALPNDVGGTAAPALGWLHVNCGACHNSNPSAEAMFTGMRFLVRPSQLLVDAGGGITTPATVESLDAYQTGYCVDSTRADDAGVTEKRIRGGVPSDSLASVLSGARVAPGQDPNSSVQMPPLVTRRADTTGHALLDAWIATLPACP